jgi:hemerythrin-like domain-containing protein
LLSEASFPRSLRGLLLAVDQELDRLPRSGPVRAALAACFPPAQTLALSAAPAAQVLAKLVRHLDEFSGVLSDTYFPAEHRRVSVQPLATLASLPPASDPFEALGRDHRGVESVLRLIDEIVARSVCGQAVDRSAVRAVVDFFTDFGALGHHEKEETILMPALLSAGFDWYDGPLAEMRRDHRQEHYFLRVLTQLCGQRSAWSDEDQRRFVDVATEFTQFLRGHMRLEHREVFEPASHKLSLQAKADLMQALAQFDAATRGDVHAALERLDSLLQKYNVTQARTQAATAADAEIPKTSPSSARTPCT